MIKLFKPEFLFLEYDGWREIEKIKKVLKEKEKIEVAYLYGSRAKGTEQGESDVDIGVLLKEKYSYDYKEIAQLSLKLEKVIGKKVDLRVLNGRSVGFLQQVLKYRRLILSRNEKRRIEFETKVYKRYLDFKPFIKHYNKIRRESLIGEKT